MTEPLITPSDNDVKQLAAKLRAMATKIELNDPASFGGSFVIIPPFGAGTVLETLILDGTQDAAQFYILLKGKIDKALVELDQARQPAAFGRR